MYYTALSDFVRNMYELTNDCGPLFSKVFSYNVKAAGSVMFSWPSNDHTDDNNYFLIINNADVNTKESNHQNRIKIKKNITYNEFESILDIYTPHIVFISSRILDANVRPTHQHRQYNDVTTLIYSGSDLRLDYISSLFPRLKYLYMYRLNNLNTELDPIEFPNLEVLSCWYADMDVVAQIKVPNLLNIDVYRKIGSSRKLKMGRQLAQIRIDENIQLEYNSSDLTYTNLQILQYFPNNTKMIKDVASNQCVLSKRDATEKDEMKSKLLDLLVNHTPRDLLLPPGSLLTDADIIQLYNTRLSQFGDDDQTLGIYINDSQINTYIEKFKNLQIFDDIQPLKCASIRSTDNVMSYLPKDIDAGISDKMFSADKQYKLLLSNFNIFTEKNNSNWMNVFGDRIGNFIYICSSELLMDNETKWPNLVKNTKNKVLIYSSDTDTIYLDINRKPIYVIAQLLRTIYDNVKFRNVYIAMRNDENTNNYNFEQSLHRELGIEKRINIFKYDVPAKILTF